MNNKLYIKKNTIIEQLLLLTVLIDINFFYIFKLPSFFYSGQSLVNKSYIIMLMLVILFFTSYDSKFSFRNNSYNRSILKYLIYFFIVCVAVIIRSMVVYNESLFDMAMIGDFLIFPFMVIVYVHLFRSADSYQNFLNKVTKLILVVFIIVAFQGIIYNFTGKILFEGLFVYGAGERYGKLRVILNQSFSSLIILYNFYLLYKAKKNTKKKYLAIFTVILGIFNYIYIDQTRMSIVAIIVSVFAIIIAENRNRKTTFYSLGLMILILGFSTGTFGNLISNFLNLSGQYKSSTDTRIYAIQYYWSFIKDNPFWGMGLVRPVRPDLELLDGGPLAIYSVDDVGIIGLFAQLGFLGFTMYLIILFRFLYILKRNKNCDEYSFLFGLFVFVLVTTPTLIILNIPRVIALPIIMGIFEYVHYRNNYNKYKRVV